MLLGDGTRKAPSYRSYKLWDLAFRKGGSTRSDMSHKTKYFLEPSTQNISAVPGISVKSIDMEDNESFYSTPIASPIKESCFKVEQRKGAGEENKDDPQCSTTQNMQESLTAKIGRIQELREE